MERIDTGNMTREEWLKSRRTGIGGSDVGAICGLSKWKSPYEVYLSKLGLLPKQEMSEQAYFGIELEQFVAKEFSKRTGKELIETKEYYRSETHNFMIANLDRKIVGENSFLECKTTSAYSESEWEGDKIPDLYMLQIQHYMYVMNCDYCYIACLIGGQKFVWKTIFRNDELIKNIIDIEKHFWEENIVKGIAPKIDGSESTKNAILSLFPKAEKKEVKELGEKALVILNELEVAKETLKKATDKVTSLENQIKDMLEDFEEGRVEGYKVTWKNSISNRFDSKRFKEDDKETYDKYLKSSESRRFLIKKI